MYNRVFKLKELENEMLDVSHVLDRNNIRTSNVIFAVADIAEKVRDSADPLYTATKLYNDILSVPVTY